MKPKISFLLLLSGIFFLSACSSGTIDLYVSFNGRADNSGSKESPCADIQEAIMMAEFHKSKDPSAKVNIHILPGDYQMTSPIRITPKLNGINMAVL